MNYYSGGLAELVTFPTDLTYSFLAHWFCGNGSLGKAMKLLGLPCVNDDAPFVVRDEGGKLLVDLDVEEVTFYSNTIFGYKKVKDSSLKNQLVVIPSKLVNPSNWSNTLRLIFIQAKWLSYQKKMVEMVEGWDKELESEEMSEQLYELDDEITNKVWPKILATGILTEYYFQVLNLSYKQSDPVWKYISQENQKNDWVLQSLTNLGLVKSGAMTLEQYMLMYGQRADIDYELACPRWKETPAMVRRMISEVKHGEMMKSEIVAVKDQLVITYCTLQKERSRMRKHGLNWLAKLREIIIRTSQTQDIGKLTRESLLHRAASMNNEKKAVPVEKVKDTKAGKGLTVSMGKVRGRLKFIKPGVRELDADTIGIFPNASTEFTTLYSKCVGIIFLAGGMTSHGAIVAREFNIPAIVDGEAINVADNCWCELDASVGEWKLIGG